MVVTMESWLEAQQAVIGSALIDSRVVPAILTGTTEADYTGHCRTVFLAIKSIFASGSPVDPVVVKNRLGDAYTGFLMQLMEITPTAANIDVYISLCRDRGRLLRLRELGQQMQEAESLDAAASLVEQANRAMVQRTTTQVVTMESALQSFYDRHDGAVSYLSWPIKELNGKLYAESGDFIILGGYPSDGKSAFAIQTACHMAKSKRVGFFSLETNPNKLFDRMIAHVAGIPMESMKTNTMTQGQWDDAAKASEHILSLQLEYVPASGYSVSDIRAMSIANRYDVIFVDYLQLVQGNGRDRYSVVTEVSIGLHQMAQSTGITVIALAQLSRPEKRRTPQRLHRSCLICESLARLNRMRTLYLCCTARNLSKKTESCWCGKTRKANLAASRWISMGKDRLFPAKKRILMQECLENRNPLWCLVANNRL